jgi:acetyl-CoA synthetase
MAGCPLATLLAEQGLSAEEADRLAQDIARTLPGAPAPARWRQLVNGVLTRDLSFAVHRAVHRFLFRDWPASAGPAPAWVPADDAFERSHLGELARLVGVPDYPALHAWSVAHRAEFWAAMIERLGIVLARPPNGPADLADPRHPDWLPGAQLNIASSCFRSDPQATAIIYQHGQGEPLRRVTYGELDVLSNRVANGLRRAGVDCGGAVAVVLPMSPEAVAIYLGLVKAGCPVISFSDSFSAEESASRLRIGQAVGLFTQEHWAGSPLEEKLYSKLQAAGAPRTVVLPAPGHEATVALRPGDLSWAAFLPEAGDFAPVALAPETASNVLFSSGTTADPKAVPWTQTTPIRSAADAWLHHDIGPGDVVMWPTSLGWMMGPWLIYATLINRATMAIYGGSPVGRGLAHFVQDAGVTVLGVVPTLVRHWRLTDCTEGCDWGRIRAFSSTGECSNTDDMLYLMYLAGWKPIIEYCGGTEIGGGYITGTVVQPAAPSTFTTPAMGLSFHLLDEAGHPASTGELFLVPPSIGLSTWLLNQDHDRVYFEGTPNGPNGRLLRRHGDQMEALPGGYFRSHGRADDAMNLKGIKVSSAELERVFLHVGYVRETAAVAVDPNGGGPSELVVYVVLKEPGQAITPVRLKHDLHAALREHHSSAFKIHDVRVTEALPRTASNKVMRRALRARYQAEQGP